MSLYFRLRLARSLLLWSLRLYALGRRLVRLAERLEPPEAEPLNVNLVTLSERDYQAACQGQRQAVAMQGVRALEIRERV